MTVQQELKAISDEIMAIRNKTEDESVWRSQADGARMVELIKRQQKLKAYLVVLK
jgi:hypothetical protein